MSLFQENGQPKNITGIFIPQTCILITEPIDAQIDELGYNIIHMYQLIGVINDEKVPGLASTLDDMHDIFSQR